MRAAVVLCLAVMAMSASAYREYAKAGAMEAAQHVHMDDAGTKLDIATRKATCPFVGSAVVSGHLPVTQVDPSGARPIASIDTIVSIGNTPKGSTLGYVLKVFSSGNHAKMLGDDGKTLSKDVPPNTFALDFPGSQGAHFGHSGILMGDPHTLNSGRWSQNDWARLIAKAQGGLLTTQAIGEFIGENCHNDPNSKTASDLSLIGLLASDVGKLLGQVGILAKTVFTAPEKATPDQWRAVTSGITKLAGDDNLIGSAGEFGLLLAFLEHSPNTKNGSSFSVKEIESMFHSKAFPAGWDAWQKSALSWVTYSTELAFYARHKFSALGPRKH